MQSTALWWGLLFVALLIMSAGYQGSLGKVAAVFFTPDIIVVNDTA